MRHQLLGWGALWLLTQSISFEVAAEQTTGIPADAATADVSIRIDARGEGPMINARVIGSNVQWVYGGDDLLKSGTLEFDPAMLSLVETMHPTVLRYPGGDQSDLYDWTRGIGRIGMRGPNLQAGTHQTQTTYMGSGEILTLANTLGAAPLFTVNVINGSAADAAAWVKLTNVTRLRNAAGKLLPKVVFWEIGNEPYFPRSDGANPRVCQLDPATFAARINVFVRAMRAMDPAIKIGIALANDTQNGIQFVSPGCRRFAATVLEGLHESIDFVSLHDAYLPYDPTGKDHPQADEYAAAMAATRSIETDMAAMRDLLQPFPAYRSLRFALTEYNASFSLKPGSAYLRSMASPMGALYVADVMRLLAGRDDILMANTWSLTANDHWGAIHAATNHSGPYGRPTYEVFRLFNEALQGMRLTATVSSPAFDAPSLGFSAAARGLPLVTTLVTRDVPTSGAGTLRVLLINKDYSRSHRSAVAISNASVASAHLSLLSARDIFDDDDLPGALQRMEVDPPVATLSAIDLPPHSIALLTLRLTPAHW